MAPYADYPPPKNKPQRAARAARNAVWTEFRSRLAALERRITVLERTNGKP